MRKFALSTLAVALLSFSPACTEPDPMTFEAHLPGISENKDRAASFDAIQGLVKGISTRDNQARKKEFGEKVTPVFLAVWDDAKEHRVSMLEMLRDMAQPTDAAIEIWSKAVALDGTTENRQGALLALQGIRDANAIGAAPSIRDAFDKLIDSPANDTGTETGLIRLEYARTLGELADKGATEVLLKSLAQTHDDQPVAVHKQVVESLALIGASDPKVIDALLAVQYRVPDAPGTQSIGVRAERALAAIGPDVVPRVIDMLKGKVEAVNTLAAKNGVDLLQTHQFAVKILGSVGSDKAVADLVAFMPADDCVEDAGKKKNAEDMDAAAVGLRAVVARAMGEIGSEDASAALCGCRNATHNAGDLWEITTALGRIGGDTAFECLTDIVTNGEYNPEDLVNSDFRYEIRWEGARFMVMAAKAKDVPKIRAAIDGQTEAIVKEKIGNWEEGIKVLESCKEDAACYKKIVADPAAKWFARETAAVQLSRLSPGDQAAAEEIARAFKVRDAGARVTMALLAARTMQGKPCHTCADALQAVMDSEAGSAKAEMQGAWMTARVSIAKLRRGPAPAAAAPAAAEKPAEEAKPAE